ncbi:DUF4231 domain-containing protein [Stenotrophomonas rhizophila]|uniref:DUF4231 domain-containing protein n=1 Tax=Stenotrophomonas rhizophila TaxID=216778 RepID=UPI0028A8DFCA|nr:DUF4231 domain-containing protein [Stenotrophomonas rhizophila]
MDNKDFPALYRSADRTSNEKQEQHLRLIKTEYGLLLLAAIFSMSQFSGTLFYAIYALIFAFLIGVLLTRAYLRPVQHWYRSRALAESAKTLTWRYMMKASPFDNSVEHASPRTEFSDHLRKLLHDNESVAELGVPDWSNASQITERMDGIRNLKWPERREFYRVNRIRNQRDWYTNKAIYNKRHARRWIITGVMAYAIAGAMTICRIWAKDWAIWPIEPIIVFASSIIGWMQLRKFGELAAAYHVTAQDIGFLEPALDELKSDEEVASFVNDAELAFSREHTMWVARQNL